MTNTPLPNTQITIIGAGIGGCIAALALAPYYEVTLIDKTQTAPKKMGESLAPAAIRVLSELNLQHLLNDKRHIASQGILSYWGSDNPTLIDNLRNPDGFGWHIDRPYFEQQLRDACITRNIQCLWSAQLTQSKGHKHGWALSLDHSGVLKTLNSHLVIDASGRHCVFARQQSVPRHQYDKLMSIGLSAHFNIQKRLALISHTDQGWWYSAPLGNTRKSPFRPSMQKRIISWQADAILIKQANISSTSKLVRFAKQVPGFSTLIEQIDLSSSDLYPLIAANSSKLEYVAGNNWFAVGDAAISFDPLASQGMFNAMASAMQLSELLITNGLTSFANQQLYQQQVEKIWQHYLTHKSLYYKMVS